LPPKPVSNRILLAYSAAFELGAGGERHVLHWGYPAFAAVIMLAAAGCQPVHAGDVPGGQDVRLAEAGSIGGSIGRRDKTISGEEPSSPAPDARPGRSTQPSRQDALPSAIKLNEHWRGLNYSITLHRVGGSNYEGTWSHGYVTKFSVSFAGNSVRMPRTDNPAFGAVTGTCTGTRTGNRASGEATNSGGAASTWDASW
jgi:hypothetical protein